jgi:hypothetical protein
MFLVASFNGGQWWATQNSKYVVVELQRLKLKLYVHCVPFVISS